MAKILHIPLFFVYSSCILFLLTAGLSLKKQHLFSLSLSAVIFLAGFLHLTNAQTCPPNHISNFVSDSPQQVYIRGKVVSSPEVSHTIYHTKKTTFSFRVNDLKIEDKWQAVAGLLKVTLYGERELGYGEQLLLEGSLVKPLPLRNPGGFNYQAYLANHNIFGLLKVKEKDAFKILTSSSLPSPLWGEGQGEGFLKVIFQFKQKLHNIIYQHLESEQAVLLSAILLGERSNLSQDTKDLFVNTGTVHILAISGLHVGLISLILLAIFRFLRLPRKLNFIFTILILIAYALLSGARASVVRATIMAVVVLLGLLINRQISIYNCLGLAALIILLANPQHLFDAGFQLSFFSVLAIVYFTPQIEQAFSGGGSERKGLLFFIIRACSVSLAAWLGLAPLIAYYFNIVSPVAIIANMVVIPLLGLVVSTGICFLIFACLWVPLGAIFAGTSGVTLFGLSALVALISKIPFAFFHCPRPGVFFICGYYALLLLLFNYKRLKISSSGLGIILLLAANLLIWRPLFKTPTDKLTVTFLDVGHGDAVFIEFPSQGKMLIDGGPSGEGQGDAGRWAILPFLWNQGINEIDALLLSHPDNDHVGGLASVLKYIKVNYVFDNGMFKEAISYRNYKTMVEEEAGHYQVLKRGERILGFAPAGPKLFVLHPSRPLLAGTGADTNNNSLVLKLVYRDVSFLFCGDIEEQAIENILPYGAILNSTVLKVPHHGSYEGAGEELLFQQISPQLAVISVDRNNRFGLPAPEVEARLNQLGARVYKTSQSGAVTISTDGEALWVEETIHDFTPL